MKAQELGFKTLSLKNWKVPDLPFFTNGLKEEEWVGAVLGAKLNANIPKDIQALYEVARAAFAYAWFCLPLTQLGAEQCFRVSEAAAREKCKQFGLPTERTRKAGKVIPTTFDENIRSLVNHGTISRSDECKWHSTRKLRNRASHPEQQTIMPPGFIIGTLFTTAEKLNFLFP